MAIDWFKEGGQRRIDVDSGAVIHQLTNAPLTHTNVYCEQPYTSPDGKRIVILRWTGPRAATEAGTALLLIADVPTYRLHVALENVEGVCNAAWSGIVFAFTSDDRLCRVDLMTCDVTEVKLPSTEEARRAGRGSTVSPDHRYAVAQTTLPAKAKGSGMVPALMRLDLESGETKIIYEHPEMTNAHVQFNPVHGRDLLVQLNRGSQMDDEGTLVKGADPELGTTHFLINSEGGNHRTLPIASPHSGPSTGHSNHIADTGLCAATVHPLTAAPPLTDPVPFDPRNEGGNLLVLEPNGDKPRVFQAPEHRFNHINVSKCGRYFVCDTLYDGRLFDERGEMISAGLVVGNLKTGKYRTLVRHTLASCANGQHTHPHAYFTADNGYVIFNADPYYGASHVFAAEVPVGFLASLD